MKNCSLVKKILSEKSFVAFFLKLKVSQCKFKQKETILKLGNPLMLKSKSKFVKFILGWVLWPSLGLVPTGGIDAQTPAKFSLCL